MFFTFTKRKPSVLLIFMLLLSIAVAFVSCASSADRIKVADVDPISMGSIEILLPGGTWGMGSALSSVTADVQWAPREDQVIVKYLYQGVTYYQYWEAPARQDFIKALDQYKQDYTANLIQGKDRTYSAYGTTTVYLRWGTGIFAGYYNQDAVLQLGYTFNKANHAPYFVVSQVASKDQGSTSQPKPNGEERTPAESGIVRVNFTRDLGEKLAYMFEDSYLRSLLPLNVVTTPPDGSVVTDTPPSDVPIAE
jgi:hypothetical protein